MKSILLAIVFLLLSALMQSTEAAGKRYAVVVGVKSYRAGQPLPELPFTENDATELAKTLQAGGYQVTLMTQTAAGKQGNGAMNPMSDYIRDQIDAVLDNPFLTEDDIVIVALAGHGVQYKHTNDGRIVPHFYFCPADADIRKVKTGDDINERNRLIDLQELYGGLKKCKAGGKLLLVDACRNDPTSPAFTRSLATATLPPLPPPPGGTAAFFSCSAHQKAYEDANLKHGVFFHHVIQALKGDADASTAKRPADGQITLTELSQHVSIETYDFVRNRFHGAKQAPELKGEFRLTVPLIELKRITPSGVRMNEDRADSDRSESPATQLIDGVITNSIGMRLKLIPAGEFMMGSPESEERRDEFEGPQHKVKISKPFHIGISEVTQSQWFSVMKTRPWMGKNDVKEGDDYAATFVNWNDAAEFCKKLTQLERRGSRGVKHLPVYRLPTEAEWEYACRAGTTTAYSFGDSPARLSDYAWWGGVIDDGNAKDEKYAHRIQALKPNPFGLYDMGGNVSEWCSDWRRYSEPTRTDPQDPMALQMEVARGGSWVSGARHARSAARLLTFADDRVSYLGFRVVRE